MKHLPKVILELPSINLDHLQIQKEIISNRYRFFSSGYSQGLDKLSYAGSSVSADFDEATGTLH